MTRARTLLPALLTMLGLSGAPYAAEHEGLAPIRCDRDFQLLNGDMSQRDQLRQAGELMGDWQIEVAGVSLDGPVLLSLSKADPEGPILRATREQLRRPFDLDDLLYFLDDVLLAGEQGRRGEPFNVNSGRARAAGILIHPDDVFKQGKERRYGRKGKLAVDTPQPQATYEPALDGDLLGPRWTARYQNPSEREPLLQALAEQRPDFALRIESLMVQVEAQGGEAYVGSTVRSRHRGYLMWGAFILSRAESEQALNEALEKLERVNTEWGLHTQIRWSHPDGWRATVEAARQMADTYDVVYATEGGARSSKHYGGVAADVVMFALPRELTLVAPDHTTGTFDLSGAEHTRDLSLSPELIGWVEEHFGFKKLRSDYPHWDDALESPSAEPAPSTGG